MTIVTMTNDDEEEENRLERLDGGNSFLSLARANKPTDWTSGSGLSPGSLTRVGWVTLQPAGCFASPVCDGNICSFHRRRLSCGSRAALVRHQ
ncbi:hypothetical protein NQZ68_002335 [Dissostichus eleginoides]|nr:hypothetical protein NQZ68_002335 [Dissostichus eleginoides]